MVVCAAVVLHSLTDVSFYALFMDPVARLGGHFYTGAGSHLGVLVAVAAASVAFYSALLMRAADRRRLTSFLIAAGLFTLYLAMDDLFLVHEEVLPAILNVDQSLILMMYGVVFAGFAWRYRHELLGHDRLLLGAAIMFVAFSIVLDIFDENGVTFRGEFMLEEGTKLMAIVGWAAFLMRRSFFAMRGEEVSLSARHAVTPEGAERMSRGSAAHPRPQVGSVKR